MRHVLLFSMFAAALATFAGALVVGCGDDPGYSGLPYAYSVDATPDGVIDTEADASFNRH